MSVQVDGVENAEVLPSYADINLGAAEAGTSAGSRFSILDLEPISLGPRMVAIPLTNNPSFE